MKVTVSKKAGKVVHIAIPNPNLGINLSVTPAEGTTTEEVELQDSEGRADVTVYLRRLGAEFKD